MKFRVYLTLLIAIALSAGSVATCFAQAPIHRYSFDIAADPTEVTDSVGGAHGVIVDAGTVPNFEFGEGILDFSENVGQPSNEITEDAYVDLPNGIITAAVNSGTAGAISLEWWASVTETRTWSRFGDFGSSNEGEDTSASGDASEYILVTPNSGRYTDGIEITNHPASNAAEPNVGVPGPFELEFDTHVLAIYDHTNTEFGDNGSMQLYVDGEWQGANAIHDDVDLNTMVDDNNWLGRSQWNDPVLVGTFDEFRIYDVAVSEDEAAASFEAGPDADFGNGGEGVTPLDDGTLTDAQARADYVHDTLKTWVGDSNLDGEFNSGDFVAVFTAGEYEDTIADNSSWVTGDWNGDKDFDSSDFVTAFTDGGYELGPRAAVQGVPEPSSIVLIIAGTLGLFWQRRRFGG